MSAPRTKEPPGHRDAILDAALDLLLANGYKRMTMEDLAAAVNLGKGTVYLYFESKEDVALSVIDRWNQCMQTRLRSVVRGRGTSAERLRALIIERVMARFETVRQFSQGLDDLLDPLRSSLRLRREKYHQAESLVFAELLIEGRTRGDFEFDEPFQTAGAMVLATNSLLPYSLSPHELGSPCEVREKVSVLADLLVRAVTRHPSPDDGVGPETPDQIGRPVT
jgi:AcrR family transcriptional regulator